MGTLKDPNEGIYTTNTQKVSSALTHFKIGTSAGNWASDLMQMALAINPPNYGTWDQFKVTFEKQFTPPASQMEAISKMHSNQMGTSDFATWFQDWSTQAR